MTKLYLSVFAAIALAAAPAIARNCTQMGFSVNDYGKEGPTNDAKRLLDTHIQKQMDSKGIAKFTVGDKSVTCKLFLDFIVFDEHTCTAIADVCWGKGPVTKRVTLAEFGALPAGTVTAATPAKPKPAARKPAATAATSPQ